MNIGGHEVANGRVDEAVRFQSGAACKVRRSDSYAEVAASIPGSFMPAVQVAFVDDFAEGWLKGRLEPRANPLYAVITHGRTCTKGRTSTPAQAPEAT
jgi:hypothetical protein